MSDMVACFDRDGFVFPIRAYTDAEIARLLRRFRAELLPLWMDPTQETDYTFQTHLLYPWLDEVIRNKVILDAVEALLGPDLLLWNTSFVAKPAHDPYYASWHQDLTYWGLEPPKVVTAWLAFTDSSAANGCVRFVPGTHQHGLLAVTETHAEGNMLSRGQLVDVDNAEPRAVNGELKAGEISIHHGLVVHGSNPNTSGDDRIGMTMTFIAPDVMCRKGRDTATLVRGRDVCDQFDLNPAPGSEGDPSAIARHRMASRRRAAIINAPNSD